MFSFKDLGYEAELSNLTYCMYSLLFLFLLGDLLEGSFFNSFAILVCIVSFGVNIGEVYDENL